MPTKLLEHNHKFSNLRNSTPAYLLMTVPCFDLSLIYFSVPQEIVWSFSTWWQEILLHLTLNKFNLWKLLIIAVSDTFYWQSSTELYNQHHLVTDQGTVRPSLHYSKQSRGNKPPQVYDAPAWQVPRQPSVHLKHFLHPAQGMWTRRCQSMWQAMCQAICKLKTNEALCFPAQPRFF